MTEEHHPHAGSWKQQAVLFLASQNLSLFGSSVTGFAIIWHITLQTSSGVWMTLIVLCSMLPQVFISPWGGVWADRHSRKHLIMASDGVIAAATCCLALLYFAGHGSLEILLVAAAVRSLGSGVQMPAVSAVVPQIVPAPHLARFNGINQTLNAPSQFLAPAVGGLALATLGIAWAFLLDVITAVLAIFVLYRIPIPLVERKDGNASALRDMREGLAFAWGTLC